MGKYTLILDSSNVDLLVAFIKDKKILDKVNYPAWQRHSETMIPEIEKMMKNNSIKKEDISSLVVTIGPGSYTGIRIALTIAKTISLALSIDLYAVSSLKAMCDFNRPSIAILNARSNRSYFGVYDGDNVVIKDCVLENNEVLNFIKSHPNYIVFGDTQYLGINGEKPDICGQITKIFDYLVKEKDPLFVKPIYLKETYETK